MTPRTPVPAEFRQSVTMITEPQKNFLRNLIDQKDLLKSPEFFDKVNAMDAEEYDAYLDHLKTNVVPNISKKKASETIEKLKALPWRPREQGKTTGGRDVPTAAQLPAGYYAIESEDGELRFYKLWRGTRNPEFFKLYVSHGPDDSEIPFKSAVSILNKIVAAGPYECALRYGREIGSCSQCGLRLTNRLSRELAIGPICGGRFFEDDPSAWKAKKAAARKVIRARGEDPNETVES